MKKKKSFTLTAVFVALVVVLNNLLNFTAGTDTGYVS